MLIDQARILVRGGKGGDGSAAFRREKFVPKGGPNGGDGGRGGAVYFRANPRLKTLLDFVRKPKFEGLQGDSGSGWNKDGRAGKDLILEVPLGTTIIKEGEFFADLVQPGELVLVAKGGVGGRGNVHFKNSVRQAPRIAERGEPGETVRCELKLRLLADVGLVGFPNAGKSTLLAHVTRAHPKIAGYPFTTLWPNLGVSMVSGRELIFADIPGLIEGSHTGKGLGHRFLAHIERTRLLVHLVDPLGFDNKNPIQAIRIINKELKTYSDILAQKKQILVVNKADLSEAEPVFKKVKRAFPKFKTFLASGVSGQGMAELLKAIEKEIRTLPPAIIAPVQENNENKKRIHVRLEPDFWVEKEDDRYVVKGKKIFRLISMTNFGLPEAVERTQNILKKMGVERALKAKGAQAGEAVRIAGMEFTFQPDSN